MGLLLCENTFRHRDLVVDNINTTLRDFKVMFFDLLSEVKKGMLFANVKLPELFTITILTTNFQTVFCIVLHEIFENNVYGYFDSHDT